MTTPIILTSIAVAITTIVFWVALSLCAVAKRADEDCGPGTGTEAPLSDERVRELLTRENYERDCI